MGWNQDKAYISSYIWRGNRALRSRTCFPKHGTSTQINIISSIDMEPTEDYPNLCTYVYIYIYIPTQPCTSKLDRFYSMQFIFPLIACNITFDLFLHRRLYYRRKSGARNFNPTQLVYIHTGYSRVKSPNFRYEFGKINKFFSTGSMQLFPSRDICY